MLLSNAIIQLYCDYDCWIWYSNLNEKFKSKLKIIQDKCIPFCIQLDDRSLNKKDLIDTFVLMVLNI